MVYNHLPNNTMWMSVAHLNDFINTSFAVDLSVVANRQSMLRAINRMRSVAPFTRNSRFPARTLHISLEGEWYSVFMRLTQLLSQRDRAANITSSQTDNIRTDNNMRALFAVVEEVNELRTRRHGFLDRETFEDIYPWEDTERPTHAFPQMEQLQRQIAELASTMRMTQTPVTRSPVVTKYNEDDIRIMSSWARPYPYSAVKERCVLIKRSIIDDVMNNPAASRVLPTDDEIRAMAIQALDKQHSVPVTTVKVIEPAVQETVIKSPVAASVHETHEVTPAERMRDPAQMTFGDYVNQILEEGMYDTDEKHDVVQLLKHTIDTAIESKGKSRAAIAEEASKVTFSFSEPVTTADSTVATSTGFVMPKFGVTAKQKLSASMFGGTTATSSGITASMLFGDTYGHLTSVAQKDPDKVTVEDESSAIEKDLVPAKLMITGPEPDPDPMGNVASDSPNPLQVTDTATATTSLKKVPVIMGTSTKK